MNEKVKANFCLYCGSDLLKGNTFQTKTVEDKIYIKIECLKCNNYFWSLLEDKKEKTNSNAKQD
ncbi:hypothetical protein M0R19_06295 [Candidatus Pacearchaeota archaeon]|nr:hypothetical protein [Candidatus Pacearchaeota archaeon]